MSLIKAIKAQLGLSVTPANNFTLDASADNGTMKLSRNSGEDIMTVDAAGMVAFPQSPTLNYGPAFQAFQGSSTNLVNNNFTTVIFNDERQDTNNGYNPANGTYTVPVTGFYQISWVVGLSAGSSGALFTQMMRNGVKRGAGSSAVISALGTISVGSVLLYCTAGDTLLVQAFQSSTVDQPSDINSCSFGAALVRAA